MGRACTICNHADRDEIDAAHVRGDSLATIAERFGVGADAVRRHCQNHLSAALVGMKAGTQAERRASLLDRIETLIERAETLYAAASDEGKATQALAVLKELRSLLELLGKATGELDDRPQLTVNLMASPEWLGVRELLLASLSPYPEARAAVSGRLLELEASP